MTDEPIDLIKVRTRVERGHTPDDLLNPAYHEWVFLGGAFRGEPVIERRDSLGRKHRNAWRHWIRLFCNNPQCEGRLLVDATGLAAALTVEAS